MTTQTFKPKRGRPSNKQVLAIDKAILETARRILLSEGFDALTMDTVASELGISKGTLYVRHPSKEALTQAVIRATIEGWSTASARNDHLLPAEIGARLKQHLRLMGRKSIEPETQVYFRLWTSIERRDPELARIIHDVGFQQGVVVLARDIEAAGKRDGTPPADAMSIATLMLSSLTGWIMQEEGLKTVTPEAIDDVADRIVDIFMAGRRVW